MSTTYNGDATNYPDSLTIPSDGDDADAASVNVPLEALADRTAALRDGGAVRTLRVAANRTAMAAIAAADGEICLIQGVGIYRYRTGVYTPDGRYTVASTVVGATGAWLHELVNLLDSSYGLPTLTLSAQLTTTMRRRAASVSATGTASIDNTNNPDTVADVLYTTLGAGGSAFTTTLVAPADPSVYVAELECVYPAAVGGVNWTIDYGSGSLILTQGHARRFLYLPGVGWRPSVGS